MELCTPGAMMTVPTIKLHLEKVMATCSEHTGEPYKAYNSTADVYESSNSLVPGVVAENVLRPESSTP